MILLRATANSQPLICSMGSVSTVVVSWYQTSCKISSASASLPTRWRMKPSNRLPKRLMTDAIFFPVDEGIRGLMVNVSSMLTRKTGEWGEYFKKGKKMFRRPGLLCRLMESKRMDHIGDYSPDGEFGAGNVDVDGRQAGGLGD